MGKLCKECGVLRIGDYQNHRAGSIVCLKRQIANLERRLAIERAAMEATLEYNSDEQKQESEARTLGLTYS